MKILSFVRDGVVDCGLLTDHGTVRVFDRHPVLGRVAPESRLFHLLQMTSEERTRVDHEEEDAPEIPVDRRQMLPAIPYCPLYIYNHGNNPTVWKRQTGLDWDLPRIPYMRVRTFNSFSGDGWEIPLAPGVTLSGGAELGIVIGRAASRVPLEKAVEHIAGLVCLNDTFLAGGHDEFIDSSSPEAGLHQNQGMHAVYKTGDGSGGIGPWITTAEELERNARARFASQVVDRYEQAHCAGWVYDKLMWTRFNGQTCDESYTNAYLLGAEWMIAYLSRFMTLPTGSIVGLGAAGWDGVGAPSLGEVGDSVEMEVELQEVGALRTRVVRRSDDDSRNSPLIGKLKALGLDPSIELRKRNDRSLWVLRGNDPASDPGVPVTGMNPLLFAPTALRQDDHPVVLPPHATRIHLSVQLAGIVGPEPLYGIGRGGTEGEEETCLESLCLLVAIRDDSLVEAVADPIPYEARAGYMLGSCGDGFFRLGRPIAFGELEGMENQSVRLTLPAVGELECRLDGYRFGFADMLAVLTRSITLLPGDILSLGSIGSGLVIPPEKQFGRGDSSPEDETLEVVASWGPVMRLSFEDQRDERFREVRR